MQSLSGLEKGVSALYIDRKGPYPLILGDDRCWDELRDARLYAGPGPVIAHPPCGPWGQLRQFCTLQPRDTGPIAVSQVRQYGGVLEHPAGSTLWQHCQMTYPGCLPDKWGGISIEIDQCRWGHPARKRSWLYIVGLKGELPEIPGWREPTAVIRPHRNGEGASHVPKSQRHLTPVELARWLVDVASQCEVNHDQSRPAPQILFSLTP